MHVFFKKRDDLLFPSQAAEGHDGSQHPFVVHRVKLLQGIQVGHKPFPQERCGVGVGCNPAEGHELVALGHAVQNVPEGLLHHVPVPEAAQSEQDVYPLVFALCGLIPFRKPVQGLPASVKRTHLHDTFADVRMHASSLFQGREFFQPKALNLLRAVQCSVKEDLVPEGGCGVFFLRVWFEPDPLQHPFENRLSGVGHFFTGTSLQDQMGLV